MAARKFVAIRLIPPGSEQNWPFCFSRGANATVLSNPTGEIASFYTCLAGKVRAQVIEHSLQNTAREYGHGAPARSARLSAFFDVAVVREARLNRTRRARNGPKRQDIVQARHEPAQARRTCR